MLPDKLGKSVTESFEHAESSINFLAEANQSAVVVADNTAGFRPLHQQVRDIRITTTKLDTEIEELETILSRLDDDSDQKDKLTAKIEALNAEREAAVADTPENWEQARADFTELQQAERSLRTDFRRSADKGYQPIVQLQTTLAATADLKSLGGEFQVLRDMIDNGDADATIEELAASAKRFGKVEGASEIRSQISKARKALRAKSRILRRQ